MGCYDADEVAGWDHLGLLPELRKMPLVAVHQVVGTGSIGALQKLVVAGSFATWSAYAGLTSCARFSASWRSCSRGPLRILSSGRESTSRYSARTASVTYSLAGFVIASTEAPPHRWSNRGF